LHGKENIFKKLRKFFELAKSLIQSYENGILEEKRELLEIVTSNLAVNGKNLMVSMRLPFSELSNRYSLTSSGAHGLSANEYKQYKDFLGKFNGTI